MKKGLGVMVAGALVMLGSLTAEACTATTVINRATSYQDTEYYDVARTVVETDTEIGQEDWQEYAATHAAIGTIMREAHEQGGMDQHLDSVGHARQLMDDGSFIEPYYNGSTTGNVGAHYRYNVHTVRDHMIYHGNEWEDGYDRIDNSPLPPAWYPEDPRPEMEDHAG